MEKTNKELLTEANTDLSQHCFERGRIHYEIEQDQEALEKKKLKAYNMDVDFKKVSEKYRKALAAQQEEARASVLASTQVTQ